MIHYPHDIDAWKRNTAELSLVEKGAYRELMDWMYAKECQLPSDKEKLYRIAGAMTAEEKRAVDSVVRQYFVPIGDGLSQPRIEEEIDAYRAKCGAAAENGKKGGRPPKPKPKAEGNRPVSSGLSQAHNPDETQRLSESEPSGKLFQKPDTNSSVPSERAPAAPLDSADVIFANGVALLTAAGVSDRNARSFLGSMRKQHGDRAVIDALNRVADEKPLQPVAWMQAALRSSAAPRQPTNRESVRAGGAAAMFDALGVSPTLDIGAPQ